MRIRRGGLQIAIGATLILLALVILTFSLLSLPRFQGLDVVPERLVFDVTAVESSDEPTRVVSRYEATGAEETITLDFPDAAVESVSIALASGNLSDAAWACSPVTGSDRGTPQGFTAVSSVEVLRVAELEESAHSRAMLFNLPEPQWTGSLTLAPERGLDGVSCRREGDLAPTKALTFRFFAPPIVTLAIDTDRPIALERHPQIYMAGEWEPSDAVWTYADQADDTSIESPGAIQWRDSTLVLHDAIWDDILDRWNFVGSAIVGALVGLIASAIATRLRRDVIAEQPPVPRRTGAVRRFRRRFADRAHRQRSAR